MTDENQDVQMKDVRFTVFKDLFRSTDVPYETALWKIVKRTQKGVSKEKIEKIRELKSGEEYESVKKSLPAIIFSGVFDQRNDKSMKSNGESGLMITDYDKFPSEEKFQEVWKIITKNKHTVFAFRSPSGNGIKALVRIPRNYDKYSYKQYFKQYDKEFQIPYFDEANCNLSRVCFESWDPDCYVNYDAEEYSPELIDEGFEYQEKEPVLILKNEQEIIDRIMKFDFKKSFVEGERNNYLFDVAGMFCEYGVSKSACEGYIINNIIDGNFTAVEAKQTVKSAYAARQFGVKYFEDYNKVNQIISDLGQPRETILSKWAITEEELDNIQSEVDNDDFWYFEGKKNPKIKVDNLRFKYFLERRGFKKHFPFDATKPIFIRVESNKVQETSVDLVKDFVLSHLYNNDHIDVWDHMVNSTRFWSEQYLSMLQTIELSMLRDTKYKSRVAYRNGIVEVTKDQIKLIDYQDVDEFIWKSQIIDRDFEIYDNLENDYKQFISNVSKEVPQPLESVIGYLLSNYKNKTNNKCVILNDELISDNPEGGTGKGLIVQGLRQIRRVAILDGKAHDENKSFPYQTVNQDTEILVFDDVKKNFDFEAKFSLVTEGITLERKGKDAIKLTVEESPKMVISTNYIIKGDGNSHNRRRHEVEIAQYYNSQRTPYSEFGRQLFDDWSQDDYLRFDNYMMRCLQNYMRTGLLAQDSDNAKLKKVIMTTAQEFIEFMNDKELFPRRTRVIKQKAYHDFLEQFPDFKKWLSSRVFVRWVKIYADYAGMKYEEGKSNDRWFLISDKPMEEVYDIENVEV